MPPQKKLVTMELFGGKESAPNPAFMYLIIKKNIIYYPFSTSVWEEQPHAVFRKYATVPHWNLVSTLFLLLLL